MQIFWTGTENDSLESCLVELSEAGIVINSVITGIYEGESFKVDYRIRTNQGWATFFVDISLLYKGNDQHIRLESDSAGNWMHNGDAAKEFIDCIDVDLPLTPLTNTLPINRLQLKVGESREIKVIYLDLLANQIKIVQQLYMRLSESTYRYQNVPNDFEAIITVDDNGFVLDYPGLFQRVSGPGANQIVNV